jgi:DNA-binding SARP family transcriptional activator
MVSQTTQLSLQLLGPPEVRLGESLLVFPTRKTLGLLVYLTLEGRPQPREHLAALMYPESSPERSYASLRNTLSRLQGVLRQAGDQLQPSLISITHEALAINPDADISLDLHTVERAYLLARSDRSSRVSPKGSASLPLLLAAVACHRGDFMSGFSLGDAPGFDNWAAIQCEIWHRRMGLILDRLSEIQFASGEFAAASETASRWIAVDALNEVAYRRKMRAHFAAGERGQALEAYEACRAVLAAELNVEPEPDTVALAARIRSQQPAWRSAPKLFRPDTPGNFLENLFAGRTSELQALVERFRLAAAGQPQVGILQGEAGIGKTRLVKEFLAWAGAQGAEKLQGHAFESGGGMPYQSTIEALRPLFEQDDALMGLLGETWLPPLSQLFPEIRQRYPDLSHAAPEAEPDRTKLYESFARFTLALAERAPLVLFMDDLQWVDQATLELLLYAIQRWRERAGLADNRVRILLLVSLQPEGLRPLTQPGKANLIEWFARLEHELTPYRLELKPLGGHDTVQMVSSILTPPAADFAQWVYDETRGQPFYLIETLKDLLERGALRPRRLTESQWTFGVDAEHGLGKAVRVPATVRAVIRSRLNRLSPQAFSLLAAGAVLEHQITFGHICAISNLDENLGLSALDELVSSQLLLEVAQAYAASAYEFAHQMIRDVVYTEAGDARRRLFHRRALEILAAAGASSAVLAHHAQAGGLPKETFLYSLAAGQEALRLSVANEAIIQFECARQILQDVLLSPMPEQQELRDLYTQLGRAYELSGQPERAIAVFAELEQITQNL